MMTRPGLGDRLTVALLACCYLMSLADRQILGLLVEPVRAELQLSDTHIGIVAGLAFAFFYTTASLPLSALADRWSRKKVLIAGVALWGTTTGLSGLATSFVHLFLCRLGVGLGEAALTPTAYAIIGERFSGPARARAMGLFVVGGTAGAGVALLIGAFALSIADRYAVDLPLFGVLAPWRLVLIGLGGATLLLTLPLLFLRDTAPVTMVADGKDAPGLGRLVAHITVNGRAFAPLFVGVPLMNLGVYASSFAAPAAVIRSYGWTEIEAGVALGTTQVAAGLLGALCFGFLPGMAKRSDDRVMTMIAWTSAAAGGFFLLTTLGSPVLTVFALAAVTFLTSAMSVLAPVALQSVSPPGSRARQAALFLLVANLVGIGLGPLSVTFISDQISSSGESIGLAMALVSGTTLASGALVCAAFRHDYNKFAARITGGTHRRAASEISLGNRGESQNA